MFKGKLLPLALLAPQLIITVIFFLWPALLALLQAVQSTDAFGLSTRFVGLRNFTDVLSDPSYGNAVRTTLVFSSWVAFLSLAIALVLAVAAERVTRGSLVYKTLLIWPYAIAPVLAGVLWAFLFDPSVGAITRALKIWGINWDYYTNGTHAMVMVVIAATWKQVSYNIIFFVAGLAAIPRSLIEAAAIDGAGPFRRFWTMVFPLLLPTSFFLLVINIIYAFFDTFGIIHATTKGGPNQATSTLIYKVYSDGFVGLDFGRSAAQSIILMGVVLILTVVQFRFIDRKIAYQ
jgi:sn-glycerol 3-phosphate transport system permease protein